MQVMLITIRNYFVCLCGGKVVPLLRTNDSVQVRVGDTSSAGAYTPLRFIILIINPPIHYQSNNLTYN